MRKTIKKEAFDALDTLSTMDILKGVSQHKRDEIVEAAKATAERAGEKLRSAAGAVNEAVHEKPWYYMGGAAVAGFITALVARGRVASKF